MVERILFVINASSATGHSNAVIDRLCGVLRNALPCRTDLQVETVETHLQAKAKTNAFLAASDAPAAIISGGGGGTLRAVIEGVCEGCEPGSLPGRERVRIAALRLGSGNVLARQFCVPRDPEAGLKGIVANLHKDRTASCCVMRCEVDGKDSDPEIRHSVTLGGFGQFGGVPGDLERWHRRYPLLHTLTAQFLGIERLTTIEYGLALLIRSVRCALYPKGVEVVNVLMGRRNESVRLLAGAIINFPIDALPFEPGVRAEDPSLSFNLIPYRGRSEALLLAVLPRRLARKGLQIRISESDCVEIRLTDRSPSTFFLDEDPMVFQSRISIRVAGTLAFVPGTGYSWSKEREVRPCPYKSVC